MSEPSATFCIRPWTSFQITANGRAKPCCWTHAFVSENGLPLTVYERSFEELWNSPFMRRMREAMLAGEPLQECRYCYREEALSGTSPRTRSNGPWFSDPAGRTPGQIAQDAAKAGHYVTQQPGLLHLDFGNACNLACRMCGGDASSRIETDPVHGKWAPRNRTQDLVQIRTGASNRFSATTYWFQQKEFLEGELLRDTSALQALYLIGGEPFLIKEVRFLLDALLDRGLETQVGLNFSTNVTHLPPEFLDRLSRFRSLQISLSLDGYGATYEYIRYPAQWEQVAANIGVLRERLPQAHLLVTPTLQAYNAFTLIELLRFSDQIGLECQVSTVVEPDFLGIEVLPSAIRERAAAIFRDYAANAPAAHRKLALTLADRLTSPEIRFQRALLETFMLFTNDLDQSRNQSLARSLPELHGALNAAGVRWKNRMVYAPGGSGYLPPALLARALLQRLYRR